MLRSLEVDIANRQKTIRRWERVGTQRSQKAWGHNDPKGEHKSRNKARKNYNKILK